MKSFREHSEELQERVNEILMDSKLSVVVEGDHDILAYEIIFNEDECHFEQFCGKENAIMVMAEVNKIKPERAIAILDNDLDQLQGKRYPDNVFFCDAHDIDAQMFLSDTYYRVAREYYTKSNTSSKQKMSDIRTQIKEFSRPLSIMRVVSDELKLHFAFKASEKHPKAFPYKDLLKLNHHECVYLGDDNLVKVTCQYRNQGIKLDQNTITQKVKAIAQRGYDDSMLLHGHDLMNMMGQLVIRYGRAKATAVCSDELERSFRLAYANELHSCGLYQRLASYFGDESIRYLT